MTGSAGLRWMPWQAEAGSWVARASSGQSWVARRIQEDGYALFYGGQHVKNCADAADFQSLAAAIESLHTSKKGMKR